MIKNESYETKNNKNKTSDQFIAYINFKISSDVLLINYVLMQICKEN